MNNVNEKEMSYFSTITIVLYSAIIAYETARIWYVGLSSPEDSLKKIALGILVFYFLLSAGMKRFDLEEDGIVFFLFPASLCPALSLQIRRCEKGIS